MVPLIVAPCFSAGEAVGGEPHNNYEKQLPTQQH
jgi:hypothetical protein